jgi:hypothetical protein
VGFGKKVVLAQHAYGDVQSAVIEQDRPEQGPLCFQVVRESPFAEGRGWHEDKAGSEIL